MAKGFAAGYAPLGVMSAREDIVETITSNGGFAHGYTYSGNPLSCSAGLAVLKEVIDEQLIKNAEIQGELLKSELKKLKNKYEFIGDVRGKGLLLAFELVANKKTMEPLPPELEAHFYLVEEAYKRGLIIYSRRSRGGNTGDHFMICPPLTINNKQIKELMNILNKSIESFAKTAKLIEK